MARVAAVIEKQTGLRLSDQDLYVNVAGGVRLAEPGIDLALAAALYSARTGQPLPKGAALAGELSLAGELRPVRQMAKRARAAKALGFSSVLGPAEGSATEREEGERKTAPRAKTGAAQDWIRADSLKAFIRELWR